MFEYGSLLITYDPGSNTYAVVDANYGSPIGTLLCDEGPGWILIILTTLFLDGSQLQVLADLIFALNSELTKE